jgi:CubicO group peptidase (beta-lactamase class C family)
MKWRTPYLIIFTVLFLTGCAGPEPGGIRGITVREVSDTRLDSFLKEMVAKEHFTGAALVMRDGKILHAKGYGAAKGDNPNNVDTRFHVGSITKEFTAAAIMQLAEKGVVRLDRPINNYLPQIFRSAKWDAVTVQNLLSHTSGITDYAVYRDYYHVVKGFCPDDTVDGMLKEAMRKDLEFMPGSKYSYTNLGYTLLGAIIENQTTTSYSKYIKDNILDPMGMTSSSIHVVGRASAKEEAEGHRWNDTLGRHVPDDIVSLPATAPDGGLITTLQDFANWARVLTGGEQTILRQESIKLMSSPQIRIGNGGPLDSMGYGLYVGDRLIGHGGLVVGFSSQFVFDRETRSLIVVFSNDVNDNPQEVVLGLLTLLLTPTN